MPCLFWLNDEQSNKISPLLPSKVRGVPRVDDRRVLPGIIYCLQRGYRWSDVPSEYGTAKTLYNRFKDWRQIALRVPAEQQKLFSLQCISQQSPSGIYESIP